MTDDEKRKNVRVFDVVLITGWDSFKDRKAVVAYIGEDGVSVAIEGLDDYIPLKWSEFELL